MALEVPLPDAWAFDCASEEPISESRVASDFALLFCFEALPPLSSMTTVRPPGDGATV